MRIASFLTALHTPHVSRAGMPYSAPAQVGPDYLQAEAAALTAGQRCCVEPGERRGEIK